jgi:hypothetical protein
MNAIDNKNYTVDELSALFSDVDTGNNLDDKSDDYGVTGTPANPRRFEDICKDIKAVMEHEPVVAKVEPTKVESVKQSEPEKKVVKVEPKVNLVQPEPEEEEETEEEEEETGLEVVAETKSEKLGKNIDPNNPLDLNEIDLKAFNEIQKEHPQFKLYDGSYGYKDFYRFKVRALKSLLAAFPVLDFKEMMREVDGIKSNYKVGGDLPDPHALAYKMGECQLSRDRVNSLLMRALAQLTTWKKSYEWINSKLWKDHDSKGAHKRDGLAADHNWDVHMYYTTLQGFVDAASLVDGYLRSAQDTLSRQITCIQANFPVRDRVVHDPVNRAINEEARNVQNHTVSTAIDPALDAFDSLEAGTVISAVKKGAFVELQFSGTDMGSDLLEDIG